MQAGERAIWSSIQNRQIMRLGHILLRVFVGKDRGSCGVKRRVVICMVEVPVGVDDVFQRSIAKAIESFFEPRPGRRNESVHNEFAVWAVEYCHGSARTVEHVTLSASFCVSMGTALNLARILASRAAGEGAGCR